MAEVEIHSFNLWICWCQQRLAFDILWSRDWFYWFANFFEHCSFSIKAVFYRLRRISSLKSIMPGWKLCLTFGPSQFHWLCLRLWTQNLIYVQWGYNRNCTKAFCIISLERLRYCFGEECMLQTSLSLFAYNVLFDASSFWCRKWSLSIGWKSIILLELQLFQRQHLFDAFMLLL